MARPFPWLHRLPDIRRSVSNSLRSHYARRDLELLFKVSSSSAGRLMKMVATESVGVAHLVGRERLSTFLEGVSETADVAGLCEKIRADRENLTRVKARYLCLRDEAEVPFASLPRSIVIVPGRLEICFDTVENLVAQLVTLGQAMVDDPLGFQAACEIQWQPEESAEARDARFIQSEIERMDAEIERRRHPKKPPRPEGGDLRQRRLSG
jgi:hypothetical protein